MFVKAHFVEELNVNGWVDTGNRESAWTFFNTVSRILLTHIISHHSLIRCHIDMATAPSLGRYELYKAGTATVDRWLIKNSPIKITLKKTSDLIQFARNIAAAKPPVEVSNATLELLANVIVGRRACAAFYIAQVGAERDKSNKTHRHFIVILENVYGVLLAAQKTQTAGQPLPTRAPKLTQDTDDNAKKSLCNMFAGLEVEEPTGDSLGTSAPAEGSTKRFTPPDPRRTATAATLKLESDEEKRFVLWSFLQDMHEVRLWLWAVWCDYSTERSSFLVASTVTDTAFGVMRRASNDLIALYPDFDDDMNVYNFLGIHLGATQGIPCVVLAASGYKFGLDTGVSSLLCPQSSMILRESNQLFVAIQTKARQSTEKQTADTHSPSVLEVRDGYRSTIDYPFHPFAAKMSWLARDFMDVAFAYHGATQADEFLKGVERTHQTGKINWWLVQACQTYMDMYELDAMQQPVGIHALQMFTEHRRSSEDEYYKTRKGDDDRVPVLEADGNMIRTLLHVVTSCSPQENDDWSGGHIVITSDRPGVEQFWPTGIHRALHLTAGERLFDRTIELYIEGINQLNRSLLVLCTAHLYRAAKYYGLLQSEWHDMDWLLATYSSSTGSLIPALNPYTDGAALARIFAVAIGVPVSALRKESGMTFRVRSNIKLFGIASPLLQAMYDRPRNDTKLGFTRGEAMDAVLHEIHDNHVAQTAKRSGSAHMSTTRATSLQLLTTFRDQFAAAEQQLHFDYLGFWACCAKLIETMQAKLRDSMPAYLPLERRAVDHFVSILLGRAGALERASLPVADSDLASAVEVLQAYVETHGADFSKAADEERLCVLPAAMRAVVSSKNTDKIFGIQISDPKSTEVRLSHKVPVGDCDVSFNQSHDTAESGTLTQSYRSPHVEDAARDDPIRGANRLGMLEQPTMGSAYWPWACAYST